MLFHFFFLCFFFGSPPVVSWLKFRGSVLVFSRFDELFSFFVCSPSFLVLFSDSSRMAGNDGNAVGGFYGHCDASMATRAITKAPCVDGSRRAGDGADQNDLYGGRPRNDHAQNTIRLKKSTLAETGIRWFATILNSVQPPMHELNLALKHTTDQR